MAETHELQEIEDSSKHLIKVSRTITINRPAEDLYAFWREPANLPDVMGYVESVQTLDDKIAHWKLKLPGGMKVEFDVEVYKDIPNEVIAWRSLDGSELPNGGTVSFRPAPANRGTQVHLVVEFVPPAGVLGRTVLKLFNDAPAQYIGQYLRELKQVMETGEKSTTKGQPSGRESEETEDESRNISG
jgi:uncharacterized membrane protein